ncbi:MAG: arginase [Candidatus Pacebacteria bacterium]|nr:arginase [Candidatus Paceibacterota bacterium]
MSDQVKPNQTIGIIGAGAEAGGSQAGCRMGPAAMRTAGLIEALTGLNYPVVDMGDIVLPRLEPKLSQQSVKYPRLKHLAEAVAWTETLQKQAYELAITDNFPLIIGGDHVIALGTVPGLARAAAQKNRPLFVLWLDAHTDYHQLDTSTTGNLHGTPVAYFTGRPSFAGIFPELPAVIPFDRVAMLGIRSVDPEERLALRTSGMAVHDMREIDEFGIVALLRRFLERVKAANGLLHVSLDVDYLDPAIAPGVGTTVPGGANFREAHLVMEMLHESALVSSLEIVELNPFLDERGRTARLLVELTASLMGRMIIDRPSLRYGE